jgi:diadenylate cyclase
MPNITLNLVIEFYLIFIFSLFILRFITSSKRLVAISTVFAFIYGLSALVYWLQLPILMPLFDYLIYWLPLVYIIVIVPDMRLAIDLAWKKQSKKDDFEMGSDITKLEIYDAVQHLSTQKTGALITIEKHNTLDQYSERAVSLHSKVSKELLINIFTPLTPLHDGAVIIRGDEIVCAGAYYVLSENEKVESTMGSRHRAGLGISEVTDSLTIVVSEETGNISIAIEGILVRLNEKEKLMEYLNTFMK